jgi:hypothetical protein
MPKPRAGQNTMMDSTMQFGLMSAMKTGNVALDIAM